jgi:hypothetical protein
VTGRCRPPTTAVTVLFAPVRPATAAVGREMTEQERDVFLDAVIGGLRTAPHGATRQPFGSQASVQWEDDPPWTGASVRRVASTA